MTADASSALQALKKKFASQMPDRVSKIEAACQGIPGDWEEETYMSTYRLVHNLKGASGTYGFPDVSKVAGELEAIVKRCTESRSAMDDQGKSRAQELIARLKKTVDQAVQGLTA